MAKLIPLYFILYLTGSVSSQTVPTPGSDAPRPRLKPLGGEWEVKYIDDSVMKITVLEESVNLITPYGPLNIPLSDIRRIDVGTKLSDADQARLQILIPDLKSGNNSKREAAKESIAQLGVRAIPSLRRALATADEASRPHVDQVLNKLVSSLEDPRQEPIDLDLIHTDHTRIAGRIGSPIMRIQTFQFGELKLKLSDVKTLQFGGLSAGEVKYELVETSSVYQILTTHMGKTVGIRVTAALGGSVWGSGPYTGDSSLAAAAIHAGVLKAGETGIVKLRIIPSPAGFTGTNANGVQTMPYGNFPSGSYEIIKR